MTAATIATGTLCKVAGITSVAPIPLYGLPLPRLGEGGDGLRAQPRNPVGVGGRPYRSRLSRVADQAIPMASA
jgi:hypothetical protein